MDKERQLGRYELITRLATGGMAEVWLARSRGIKGFKKTIVLKTILPHLADNPDFVRMFINEALLAAVLNHPNIVQIFDLGEIDDRYFIAMEYIDGRTLRQAQRTLAKEKKIPPPWLVLQVAMAVCDALEYAHNKCGDDGTALNIVHRDVTPENIMISFAGTTKVLDFGIAKASRAASETKAGTLKGKYAYMAPERVIGARIGEEADRRSDIYSLGVVLYEMLTGVRPFRATNELMLLKQITEGKPTPPRKIARWVPERLDAIVIRAIHRDTEKRYNSSLELRHDIHEFLDSVDSHPTERHVSEFMHKLFKMPRRSVTPITGPQQATGTGPDTGRHATMRTGPGTEDGQDVISEQAADSGRRYYHQVVLERERITTGPGPSEEEVKEDTQQIDTAELKALAEESEADPTRRLRTDGEAPEERTTRPSGKTLPGAAVVSPQVAGSASATMTQLGTGPSRKKTKKLRAELLQETPGERARERAKEALAKEVQVQEGDGAPKATRSSAPAAPESKAEQPRPAEADRAAAATAPTSAPSSGSVSRPAVASLADLDVERSAGPAVTEEPDLPSLVDLTPLPDMPASAKPAPAGPAPPEQDEIPAVYDLSAPAGGEIPAMPELPAGQEVPDLPGLEAEPISLSPVDEGRPLSTGAGTQPGTDGLSLESSDLPVAEDSGSKTGPKMPPSKWDLILQRVEKEKRRAAGEGETDADATGTDDDLSPPEQREQEPGHRGHVWDTLLERARHQAEEEQRQEIESETREEKRREADPWRAREKERTADPWRGRRDQERGSFRTRGRGIFEQDPGEQPDRPSHPEPTAHEQREKEAELAFPPEPEEAGRERKRTSLAAEVQARANFELGLTLIQKNDYEGALAAWSEAQKLDPDNRLYQGNIRRLQKLMDKEP